MANTLEDLQRDLERFRVKALNEIRDELHRVAREAVVVIKRHTPVRTGRTRRSIGIAYRTPNSATIRIRDREVYNWIFRLERRHHMFRHGQAFINRELRTRLAAALRRAGDSIFR